MMQTPIPQEAFSEILKELDRQPVAINNYRNKSGSGRSQTWGVIGRRCLPPDASRMNWERPYLYHLLLEFGKKYVSLPYTSITVNQNYQAAAHYDKNNKGNSFLVGFGNYTGGKLKILEGDLSGTYDINCKPIVADFSKMLHEVEPFQGSRYSLVYYCFENKKSVPLPTFDVKEEGGKWFFFRDGVKITKEEGMPHPRRKLKEKKSMIQSYQLEFEVRFD